MKGLVLSLIAILVGCVGGPIRSTPPMYEPKRHLDAIGAIQNWSAVGRVAIERGSEGWTARLQWRKTGTRFQLRLVGPLGRGTYQLAGDGTGVELIVPDGGRFYASDAETLMDEHFGWSIPVDGAEYWIRGLVAPNSTPKFVNRDEVGQLLEMEQDGWRINVLRHGSVNNLALPSKLLMYIGDLKVRIVISSWKFTS